MIGLACKRKDSEETINQAKDYGVNGVNLNTVTCCFSSVIVFLTFRCGMIYMEPSQLGWEPLVASWMEKEYPPNLSTASRNSIQV